MLAMRGCPERACGDVQECLHIERVLFHVLNGRFEQFRTETSFERTVVREAERGADVNWRGVDAFARDFAYDVHKWECVNRRDELSGGDSNAVLDLVAAVREELGAF